MLLALLDPLDDNVPELVHTAGDHVDWPWILNRAEAHKVAGLFISRMNAHGLSDRLPSRLRTDLKELAQLVANRTTRAQQTVRAIADAFDRSGIEFFLLKGSVLAEHVYQDPLLRPYSDIDVLVNFDQINCVESVLSKIGFAFHCREGRAEQEYRRDRLRNHHHLSYVDQGQNSYLPIEVHWRLFHCRSSKINAEEARRHCRTVEVAGIELQTLNVEAMLVHVARHAMEAGPVRFRLLHLCDVAWMVARFGEQINEESLWQRAKAWNSSRHLKLAVQTAARLFRPSNLSRRCPPRVPPRRLWRQAFESVSSEQDLVDQMLPPGQFRRLAKQVTGSAVWEIAKGDVPWSAVQTIFRAGISQVTQFSRGK